MADGGHWLAGRVAVVTGASRGIGRATAVAVAREGAHVIVAARGAVALDATVAVIREAGGQATAVPTDVANADEVDELFGIASGIGPPVALVCAAGALENERFDEISLASWEHTISVNLTGVFNCCRAAFALMRDASGGRIVNIASLSERLCDREVPRACGVQRIEEWCDRTHRGYRRRGQTPWHHRDLGESGRCGHRHAPPGQPLAATGPGP